MGSMLLATNILPPARFKAAASEVINGMKAGRIIDQTELAAELTARYGSERIND